MERVFREIILRVPSRVNTLTRMWWGVGLHTYLSYEIRSKNRSFTDFPNDNDGNFRHPFSRERRVFVCRANVIFVKTSALRSF